MVNPDKLKLFQMKNTAEIPNLKDATGETFIPKDCTHSAYNDADGKLHEVLTIETDGGKLYRTEVFAFIEKFAKYEEIFMDEKLEDRPPIKILGTKSKKGNPYIRYELVIE